MISRKIFFFAIILASIFIINNFVHSIYNLWQKNNLISNAKQELDKEKRENKELKKKLSEVKSDDFLEKEIRDRLFLAKPEEEIVFLPKNYLSATESGKTQIDTRTNWQKWWDLFFNKTK